ncbi:MAG: CBS domain-containing protein [Gammaproteobacteria bacterium]|nr:CBS domain-containing protein [Gammaproteobacteria bacterium]MDH5630478.1 CBS domain-containing protein [Gammaproteobacteria bacterium]
MSVQNFMNKRVITVTMDDPLTYVKSIFDTNDFHHLLVVEGKKLKGIISDRDLLNAISPYIDDRIATSRDLATLNKKAHQIMRRDPITLLHDDSVFDAIKILNQVKVDCIPVVDKKGNIAGILSWRDIIRAMGQLLERRETS